MSLSDPLLVAAFVVGAGVSLGTSWLLVSRLERIGTRLGLTEGLLGMVAALAADAPELTAAVTALVGHQSRIGAGVVVGSNVFNLAALLGVGAVVAGRVLLHRRVIALEGAVALVVAALCVAVVVQRIPPAAGLAAALVVLAPYALILGVRPDRLYRLGLSRTWARWLTSAVHEEELELRGALDPRSAVAPDVALASLAVVVVVGASIGMEQAASELGTRHSIPQTLLGGLILAGVTSLPNAVAAVYLAVRGRGAATLSTAMNSNALNVTAGLLLPASFLGLGALSGAASFVAIYYLGLTAFVLGSAYLASGLRRVHGFLIVGAYLVFAGLLVAIA